MYGVLHGRALPVATAIKAANPGLTVIAEGGDGDMYGEGGNHFLHTIRRNPDIVHIVHNNMVYGLTKGQASPTSQRGFVSKVQVEGAKNEPFNPLSVALSLKAGFVSRVNIGNYSHAKEVLKAAFLHKGYALVDIFQPCVVFNQVNTYQWFKENTYLLEEGYDSSNFEEALKKAYESMPMPLGILYQRREELPTFEMHVRGEDHRPLHEVRHNHKTIQELFETY
jgi:2-oxoglutarate ferredoxin oxidoreductase subunit beta